jgi:hypothetical protein
VKIAKHHDLYIPLWIYRLKNLLIFNTVVWFALVAIAKSGNSLAIGYRAQNTYLVGSVIAFTERTDACVPRRAIAIYTISEIVFSTAKISFPSIREFLKSLNPPVGIAYAIA